MGTLKKKIPGKKRTDFINWFEISVTNLNRAVAFYNHIFSMQMEVIETVEYSMAIFPSESGIGGALVQGQGCIPSETGALLYLNANDDLSTVLNKIDPAGGRTIMGKTLINAESGYFALFVDTEGNKLALHSNN